MALIVLVGSPDDPFADADKPKRRGGRKKPKAVLEEVAEEVRTEPQEQAGSGKDAPSSKKAAAKADAAAEESGEEAKAEEAPAAEAEEAEEKK